MQERISPRVTAVIVTYYPEIKRLKSLLLSVVENCDSAIVVDNASTNFKEFPKNPHIAFYRFEQNVGIAKALNTGCQIAIKNSVQHQSDWILTLDQDTMLCKHAIREVLARYSNLNEQVKNQVGVIALSNSDCGGSAFQVSDFEMTSGNMVKASLFASDLIKFREEFFIDQVDFDFDIEVRKAGFIILKDRKKRLDHKAGSTFKVGTVYVNYEGSRRMYYLARNSTALLLHGLPITMYLSQLERWTFSYVKVNGFKSLPRLVKILFTGFIHSKMHRFGKFDAELI